MSKFKRLYSIMLAAIVSTVGCSLSALAEEVAAVPIPKDSLDLFIDTLDPSLHSGLYYNSDDQLCLGTTDADALNQVLASQNMEEWDTFELVITKYSLKDMQDAQQMLLNQRLNYNISAVGFDIENNGLAVFVPDSKVRSANEFTALVDLPVVIVPDCYLGISSTLEEEQSTEAQAGESRELRATLRSGAFIGRTSGTS